MLFTVSEALHSAKLQLAYWKKRLEELNNGTVKYDGSMPKSCVNALIKHKAEVYTDLVNWLNTFDKDEVISNGIGRTKIGAEYYTRINK